MTDENEVRTDPLVEAFRAMSEALVLIRADEKDAAVGKLFHAISVLAFHIFERQHTARTTKHRFKP